MDIYIYMHTSNTLKAGTPFVLCTNQLTYKSICTYGIRYISGIYIRWPLGTSEGDSGRSNESGSVLPVHIQSNGLLRCFVLFFLLGLDIFSHSSRNVPEYIFNTFTKRRSEKRQSWEPLSLLLWFSSLSLPYFCSLLS